MSSVFFNNGIEEFLQILQSHAETQEEVAAHTAQALSCIADIMHIGKVEVYLSAPQSKLRDKIDDFSNVLYGGTQEIAPEPYAFDFRTGDGGLAVFTFYAAAGYAWNKFEQAEIGIFAKQIYLAFSQVMMGSLLKRSMLTDLSVGIPNVSGVMEYAGRLFGRGILTEYTAIYFNIHNFRYVNKVLPHLQADEVMKLYSNMVANSVTSQELVGRLGGDNFVALVRTENAENFVNFISNMDIIYPYVDEVKRFNFSATIGVGNLEGIRNVGELMQRSSIAYQMARQSDTVVAYYTDEMYREIMQQKETIARFHRAIKQKEFVVYYQPKITTADKKICGAEALVRWKEKERIIPPGLFIPILEKDGSVCKLDFYVLDQVCDLLERLMKAGSPLLKISVNFSKKHVENPYLVQEITEVIDRHNVPHEYLEIELTESEDFRDYVVLSKLIEDLKAVNISTSIDDFGTGYSSLNMLKMTPIDLLKIDKSFIPLEAEYEEKQKDIIMFENIARLAKELGIQIIAEGVETQQQYEYLADVGCDMIQGYYFDKPLPEEEFLERVNVGHY